MNDDVISRAAAIDALKDRYYKYGRSAKLEELVWAIERLPSAQPAPCEFCKHNNIADDKVCLMCSAERRTDEGD